MIAPNLDDITNKFSTLSLRIVTKKTAQSRDILRLTTTEDSVELLFEDLPRKEVHTQQGFELVVRSLDTNNYYTIRY
jgi:hypothetical protein